MNLSEHRPRDIDPLAYLYRRLGAATFFLFLVTGLGTFGYHYLGDGQWQIWDCFYMTVVTLSTVGFGETLEGIRDVYGARGFTVLLIVLGSGTLLYFVSTFTAFIVEGDLVGALKKNRMHKTIDKLHGHVIVCGVGTTGIHVVEELIATKTPFVCIDVDEERLLRLQEDLHFKGLLYVVGDATQDDVLEHAGIRRAHGIISALHEDKDNLFVTISARALNANLRIVAKAVEVTADAKLRRAGANTVVSPNRIGGMRLVSEMLRPRVVQFLDDMLRDKAQNLRIEEVEIPETSPVVGHPLRSTAIRRAADVLVIAVRDAEGGFHYNPGADLRLLAGMWLIVLARQEDVAKLRAGMRDGTIGLASASTTSTHAG